MNALLPMMYDCTPLAFARQSVAMLTIDVRVTEMTAGCVLHQATSKHGGRPDAGPGRSEEGLDDE